MDLSINILNQKLELINWLSTTENIDVLDKVMKMKIEDTQSSINSVSENEINSILEGLKDAQLGNFKTHTSAKKLYEKWL